MRVCGARPRSIEEKAHSASGLTREVEMSKCCGARLWKTKSGRWLCAKCLKEHRETQG